MTLPPTAVEKGLVLNLRTGALYGAAAGFAIGLAWQAFAGYDNPLPLWRWLIVGGAALGGSLGFGHARARGGTMEGHREAGGDERVVHGPSRGETNR